MKQNQPVSKLSAKSLMSCVTRTCRDAMSLVDSSTDRRKNSIGVHHWGSTCVRLNGGCLFPVCCHESQYPRGPVISADIPFGLTTECHCIRHCLSSKYIKPDWYNHIPSPAPQLQGTCDHHELSFGHPSRPIPKGLSLPLSFRSL